MRATRSQVHTHVVERNSNVSKFSVTSIEGVVASTSFCDTANDCSDKMVVYFASAICNIATDHALGQTLMV